MRASTRGACGRCSACIRWIIPNTCSWIRWRRRGGTSAGCCRTISCRPWPPRAGSISPAIITHWPMPRPAPRLRCGFSRFGESYCTDALKYYLCSRDGRTLRIQAHTARDLADGDDDHRDVGLQYRGRVVHLEFRREHGVRVDEHHLAGGGHHLSPRADGGRRRQRARVQDPRRG